MIYYIDGYNLLFRNKECIGDLTKIRKEGLEDFYQKVSPFSIRVVVVFDAYQQMGVFSRVQYKKIELVYTCEDQKADDYIIEEVRRSKNPEQVVVVSNDRALSASVRLLRGRCLKFNDFFALLKHKKKEDKEKATECQFNEYDFDYYTQAFLERLEHPESDR